MTPAVLLGLISLVYGAGGLHIRQLVVPPVVDVRSSALLSCLFELGDDSLHSIKWYKDDLEFFRYTQKPTLSTHVITFRVDGVQIKMKQSNMTSVWLEPLDYSSSGSYRCEVSAEAPHFNTVVSHANMTVLGLPDADPIINGIRSIYPVGEYVTGNCTSAKSYPPAIVEWFINEQQIEPWQLEFYTSEEDKDEHGLESTTLGISFQADNSHFPGKKSTMRLRCVARTQNIVRQTEVVAELADIEVAQGLYTNQGCVSAVFRLVLLLVLVVPLVLS